MDEQKRTDGRPTLNFLLKHKILLIRWFIGGVFLYAGFIKITDTLSFSDSIATFRMLPDSLINLIALGLPPLEILLGMMLITNQKIRLVSFCVILLSSVFGIALTTALLRGIQVNCGCFGSGKPSTLKTVLSIGRNALLLGGALILYKKNLKYNSTFITKI